MNKYSYTARNGAGELVKGEVEASSSKDVAVHLDSQGLILVSIVEHKPAFNFSKIFNFSFSQGKVKLRDLNVLFRQLSVLSNAGVPLIESFSSVEEQIGSERLKNVVKRVQIDIGEGLTLSQALAKHLGVFPQLVISMVEAGEKSGTLDEVLKKVTAYYEKEIMFQQKIQAALRYPVLVVVALAVAFVVVITFVVPQFSVVFSSLKAELPLPTRILIGMSVFARTYWYIILIAVFGLGYALKSYIGTQDGRKNWDQLMLHLPIFGSLVTKLSLARFFRMLATMIGSGIPIIAGLETTANTTDNIIISNSILRIRDKVASGSVLSAPMTEEKIFPPTAIQMIAVGEKSGSLDVMLNKSADYFDEETDYMVSNMMTLLEPILILCLGGLVVLLALGILLPMWSLMSVYTKGI